MDRQSKPIERRPLERRQRAFSLVELLVVVGIIILLLAILLPALATAKIQARRADTTTELKGISHACDSYYLTFGFYPGPVREADIAQMDNTAPTTNTLCGTQNMSLGLLGVTASTATAGFTAVTVSQATGGTYPLYVNFTSGTSTGPIDLGNGNKQYAAFYAPKTADYQRVPSGGANPGSIANPNPTLWDHFIDPLPIMYFRRTPNVDGVGSVMFSSGTSTALLPAQNSAQKWSSTTATAYFCGTNTEYWNATALISTSGGRFNEVPTSVLPSPLAAESGTTTMSSGIYDTTVVAGVPAPVQQSIAPFPEGTMAAWSVGGTQWDKRLAYGTGGTTGAGNKAFICKLGLTGTPPYPAPVVGSGNWNVAPSQGGYILVSPGQSRMYGNTDNIVVIGGQ